MESDPAPYPRLPLTEIDDFVKLAETRAADETRRRKKAAQEAFYLRQLGRRHHHRIRLVRFQDDSLGEGRAGSTVLLPSQVNDANEHSGDCRGFEPANKVLAQGAATSGGRTASGSPHLRRYSSDDALELSAVSVESLIQVGGLARACEY